MNQETSVFLPNEFLFFFLFSLFFRVLMVSLSLSCLPAELMSLIVAKMDKSARIKYASTSTHSMWDVFLLAGSRFRTLSTSSLPRHLVDSVSTYPRSHTYLAGQIEIGGWGFAAAKLPEVLSRYDLRGRTLSMHRLPSVRSHILSVNMKATGLGCIPAGLVGLREVDVSSCSSLAADWLPESSAASIERLVASSTPITRLPAGMSRLREIRVRACRSLSADWLPESSRPPGLTICR